MDVPLLIFGIPAYPLLPWLMRPYTDYPGSTAKERNFNYRQSRAQMCVENAFGWLIGRWRCLLKWMDYHVDNVPDIIATCVTLHNLCEVLGDNCQSDWFTNDTSLTSHATATTPPASSPAATTATATATSIRDAIRDSL